MMAQVAGFGQEHTPTNALEHPSQVLIISFDSRTATSRNAPMFCSAQTHPQSLHEKDPLSSHGQHEQVPNAHSDSISRSTSLTPKLPFFFGRTIL